MKIYIFVMSWRRIQKRLCMTNEKFDGFCFPVRRYLADCFRESTLSEDFNKKCKRCSFVQRVKD